MRGLTALLSLLPALLAAGDYPVLRELHPFPYSRFFVPNHSQPRTSVVMLHGSEGGSVPYIESEATILASQGFAVLVLCYFDCGRGLTGPRQTLRDIDVGIVHRAVRWLREQPASNGKVAVYGFSRGAELALIAGSLDVAPEERPDALLAHSPSDTYNSFFNWSWQEPSCWICNRGQGVCNPAGPRSQYTWNISCGPDDETRMDFSRSAWLVNGLPVPAGTRIAVERLESPILITVGEDDDVWPVAQTRRIEARLVSAGRLPQVHYFPGAKHVFGYQDENRRRQLVFDFLRAIRSPE
jgi:dienelactone hydrolase